MPNFDTRKLVKKIETRKKPLSIYIGRYFKIILESVQEEIMFDEVIRTRRIAPYVSPMSEGQVMKSQGSSMKMFKPAYVKPKQVLQPSRALKRLPGEGMDGELSPDQRRKLITMEMFVEQDEMIDNRLELMAAELVQTGQLIIEGDNYPKQVVDFGRDAGLTKVLVGTARWGQADADPMQDIEDMAGAMSVAPHGRPARDLYFSPEAWAKFRVDPKVEKERDTEKRGTGADIDSGPLSGLDDVVSVGTLSGRFNLFVDSRSYEDAAGAPQRFVKPGDVNFFAGDIEGHQCFGAILDDDVLLPMRAYGKTWKQPDPSVRFVMTQSAPLLVAGRINGTACMSVL